MPSLSAQVAIIERGRILLTKREDFKVWCLPGGGIEEGESPAQAAVREAREETGLVVEMTRLVGIYSRENVSGHDHAVVFAARPVGGALAPDPHEVDDARFCDPDDLPAPILRWHRQRIADALAGIGGSVAWRQHVNLPLDLTLSRAELYALRDQDSPVVRQIVAEFTREPRPGDDTREVGPPDDNGATVV